MIRAAYLVYGVVCYLLFLAVYTWMAGFFANVEAVGRTLDGPALMPAPWALAIDAGLVLLFALQHSVMARPAFKQVWTQFIPEPIERSTYVLFSCVALGALMFFWQPLGGVVWDLPQGPARWLAWTFFAIGWCMVPAVSHMLNHYYLFGLRQVWRHWQEQAYTSLPFETPYLYNAMRHPLYVGWTIAFWATPTMTLSHLVLASLLTGYMLMAVYFEERDLVAHFGEKYEDYRRRVPMFVPNVFPGSVASPATGEAIAGNTERASDNITPVDPLVAEDESVFAS